MSDSEWLDVGEFDPDAIDFPFVARVGDKEIAIFRVEDSFKAIQRWCPHQTGDLALGTLMGGMVKCPLHGFIFRFSDGEGINCPGFTVTAYEVCFEDCRLKVRKIAVKL